MRLARRREAGALVERDRAEVGLVGVELDARGAARPCRIERGVDERAPDAGTAGVLLDEEVLEPAVRLPGPDRMAVAQLADARRRTAGSAQQVLSPGVGDQQLD